MDVGLGLPRTGALERRPQGRLNPCFSGCWSRTVALLENQKELFMVLILVLVDVGLGHKEENR